MAHVFLILILTCCAAFSAETRAVVPTRIIDANTLEVIADLAGQPVYVRIAMQYVSTPREHAKSVKAVLYKLLGTNARDRGLVPVMLSTAEERFRQDELGNIMAVIAFPRSEGGAVETSPLGSIAPTLEYPFSPGESIQEYLVRNGLAIYTSKTDKAAEPLHSRLVSARLAAQENSVGLWKKFSAAMLAVESAQGSVP